MPSRACAAAATIHNTMVENGKTLSAQTFETYVSLYLVHLLFITSGQNHIKCRSKMFFAKQMFAFVDAAFPLTLYWAHKK